MELLKVNSSLLYLSFEVYLNLFELVGQWRPLADDRSANVIVYREAWVLYLGCRWDMQLA